jgi:hypothetical protein
VEGKHAGAHLIEHGAEREQIGAAVEIFSADLLRAHVSHGADGGAGAGEICLDGDGRRGCSAAELRGGELGEAEIENFGLTFRRDEDICRLDVAMDDAFGVGGVESTGDLHAEIEDGFDVEGLFRDQMLEGVALEKFHGDECAIFTLVDVVDGANVGVVESGGGASLATETFERLRIVSDVVGQEFQGDKGPGLLAHVLVSKFGDHLPLYRQSEIYARQGVELDRSTLADWVCGTSQLFEPLVEALRRHVMAAQKLHAGDTPVPVLAPGNGKTKTGRLWTYVRDDRPAGDQTPPAVWFAYTPDRKGEHPQTHLGKFMGTLQADGYAGFEQIYETGRIQEAACWAHVRRKFYDLQEAHKSPVAAEALERIGALYAVESDINGRSPEERREVRNARSRPLLQSLKQWLEEILVKLSKKSDTATAVRYALGRWEALLRYCNDGHLEIDNNAAERSLRAVALGRKNYLFAGSDRGGESAAAIYSLVGTAKLNGIDPESYLRNVLSRIPDHPINRIEELLPWNVAAEATAPSFHPAWK